MKTRGYSPSAVQKRPCTLLTDPQFFAGSFAALRFPLHGLLLGRHDLRLQRRPRNPASSPLAASMATLGRKTFCFPTTITRSLAPSPSSITRRPSNIVPSLTERFSALVLVVEHEHVFLVQVGADRLFGNQQGRLRRTDRQANIDRILGISSRPSVGFLNSARSGKVPVSLFHLVVGKVEFAGVNVIGLFAELHVDGHVTAWP